jgi:hypothetical protein
VEYLCLVAVCLWRVGTSGTTSCSFGGGSSELLPVVQRFCYLWVIASWGSQG